MKQHDSIHVTESLYCYSWQDAGNNCNACVLTNALAQGKPHILVDPGHIINEADEACFDSLEQAMQSDGIKVEDVGLIINTHSHPDHSEANQLVVERSGARVTMSEEEDHFRTTIGRQMFTMFGMTPPDSTPAFYLKEGDLDIVNKSHAVRILLTPGHSPGSVCLYLPGQKTLITGDVVFYMSVGRTDFPGGSSKLLKESIERLSKLDVEHLVPGHNTDPRGVIEGKEEIRRNFTYVQAYFE